MRRPKVLAFASLPPLPIDRGDKNRLFHILRLLNQFADIRLVCLSRDWEPTVTDWSLLAGIETRVLPVCKREVIRQGLKAMARFRPFTAFRFGQPRIVDAVRQEVEKFQPDIFWAYGIQAYPILQRMTGLRRVLDLGDSPSLYNATARRSSKMSLPARVQSFVQWRIQFYERSALESSHHVLVSSRRDREHLLRLHGDGLNIHVLENCIPSAFMAKQWRPRPNRSPKLLFVGNMYYPPNAAGALCAARHVLPRVRSRFPQAELIVCGRGGARLGQKLTHQAGVRVVGYVEDLVSMYLDASVVVSPVPVIGGTQYKVLEAMALGVPVATTRPSAELGEMTPGKELLVGDSAEDLALAVLSILEGPELAAGLSANSRAFIRKRHTWESKTDLLRSVVLNPEGLPPSN